MNRHYLRVLGAPLLLDPHGQRVEGVRTRDLCLLAYLVREARGPMRRDVLAALFWESSERPRARAALRQTLFRLRSVLGAGLQGTRHTVDLDPSCLASDVGEFEADLNEGRPAVAVDRWKGEFLDGTEDVGRGEYRVWLEACRTSLHGRLDAAYARLVDRAAEDGRISDAIAESRRWQSASPLAITPLRRLVELLRTDGRPREALAHVQASEIRLADLEPEVGPALLELRRELEVALEEKMPGPGSAASLSPELVGRATALDELERAWMQSLTRPASPVLVEGDEGIGKTRLGEAFLQRLSRKKDPPLILVGRGGSRSDSYPALRVGKPAGNGPGGFGEMWAPLRHAPGLSAASGGALAELSRMLPHIRSRFPDLPDASGGPGALLRAVREVLDCVAHEVPVVVFVDDLSELSPDAQGLVSGLAEDLPTGVLLVATAQVFARDSGVGESRPPGPWVRLRLRPLTRTETDAVVSSMVEVERSARPELVRRLHEESRGNPLYLVELVAALMDDGRLRPDSSGIWHMEKPATGVLPLPSDIRAVILRRLDRTEPDARRALSAAATMHSPFSAGEMCERVGLQGTEAARALQQLLGRRLLRESSVSPGRYEFRHESIRRVVLDGLGPDEISRLRADALEAESGPTARRPRSGRRATAAVALAAATGGILLALGFVHWRRSDGVPRVAVEPVRSVSPDTSDTYLAVGLEEELAHRLGGLPGLHVVRPSGRSRTRPERAGGAPASEARSAADYVLEGTVRRGNGLARVQLQLIESRKRVQLWSETFDINADQILDIESRIAWQVTQAVKVRLAPDDRERLAHGPTGDPVAYDRFLRGNHALRRRTPGATLESIHDYEEASALDSTFAAARAREAYAYALMLDWGWLHPTMTPKRMQDHALTVADEAIRLDSTEADGWLAKAYLLAVGRGSRPEAAVPLFERAIALDPRNAEAFHQYGQTLMILGRFGEAAEAYRNALAIDPGRSMTLLPLAAIEMRREHPRVALALLDSAVDVDPTVPYVWVARASYWLEMGDPAQARRDARRALGTGSGYELPALAMLGAADVADGRTDEGRAALLQARQAFPDESAPSPTEGFYLGEALLITGDSTGAMDVLERVRPRNGWVWFYTLSSIFDPIRDHPRFRAIIGGVQLDDLRSDSGTRRRE